MANVNVWAGILLAIVIGWGLTGVALYKSRASYSEYRAEIAQHLVEANKNARTIEREMQEAVDEAARQVEERRNEEQEVYDSTIADLRNDNLRLRQHWQGCEATSRVSSDSLTASYADAGAEERAASAAGIVRVGRQCDNWIIGLQEYAEEVSRR